MNTSDIACVCILDVECRFNESYYSWIYGLLKQTDHYSRFDVYVCTINEEGFLKSNLYGMLKDLQNISVVNIIFTIQFSIHSNRRLYEMATLCENFREVNQFIHKIDKYEWYFQLTPTTDFDISILEKLKTLKGFNLNPNKLYYLTNNASSGKDPFSFLMTGNRFIFNNIQNIISFINSDRITLNYEESEPDYFIKRLLQRMNCEYTSLENIK